MESDARIRRATGPDAPAITALALRSKASNGYDHAFMRACEAELTYTPATIASGETWVAESADKELLGFFDLRPVAPREAEVYAMFVEPGSKRSGLGRALWSKLEERAGAIGARTVNLDADPYAVPFYSAMGMRVTGSSPSGSIPGRMLPRMTKSLAGSQPGPVTIEPVSSLDLRLEPFRWTFADARRAEIDLHWKRLKQERPGLWNGEVVLTRDVQISAGRLSGRCFSTDYASFIAWRDWNWPDTQIADCFGAALILSSDGALLYGRMAGSTLNAGQVYPPSGAVDPEDVAADGRIDIEGSLARELAEETGLNARDARPGRLWAVRDGCRLCLARELRFEADADTLRQVIERFGAAEARPELDGVVVLRSAGDIGPDMPPYAAGIARHLLG